MASLASPETVLGRMADKFTVDDGCWEWTACRSRGYGQVSVNGKHRYAHRIMYELLVGPIPDGLVIDHLCQNTGCVRPEHLEPVTNAENIRRGRAREALLDRLERIRSDTHCSNGHIYDEANSYIQEGKARRCRACARERSRAYRLRVMARD